MRGGAARAAMFIAAFGASSCGTGAPEREQSAKGGAHLLQQRDSIVLGESDAFLLAKPVGFTVGGAGRYFVSDAASSQVGEFAPNGDFVRSLGRRGSGPGELRTPTTLAMEGDSLVAIMDFATLRLSMWSLATGRMVRELRLPGKPWSIAVTADGVFAGYYDPANSGSVAVWNGGGDAFRMIGPAHAMFSRVPPASSLFGQNEVLVTGDTVATAFEISNHLYLHRVDGTALDSLELPRTSRAGAQTALLERVVATDPSSAYPALYQSSLPLALGRLSSGAFVLITADPAMVNGRATGVMHASLADFDRRAACVDIALPVPTDPLPRAEIHDDELYVLAQHVADDDQVLTVVHVYRINPSACEWTPGR